MMLLLIFAITLMLAGLCLFCHHLKQQEIIDKYSDRILGDYKIPWNEYKSMTESELFFKDIIWVATWASLPLFIKQKYDVRPDFNSIPRCFYKGQTHFKIIINGFAFWSYEKILMDMYDELQIKTKPGLQSLRESLNYMDKIKSK